MQPRERLTRFREKLGLSQNDLAQRAQLEPARYYDLEAFDDLEDCISLGELSALARVLNVRPSELFKDDPPVAVSPQLLAQSIRRTLADRSMDLSVLEEIVGWEIAPFVEEPSHVISKWNVVCLRAVCDEVGENWMAVLNGWAAEEESAVSPPSTMRQ